MVIDEMKTFVSFFLLKNGNNLPIADVDVDVNAYADVDDDAILVLDTVVLVQRLNYDPKIDYLIHDEEGQLDQLFDF